MHIEDDYKIAPAKDGRFVIIIKAYNEPLNNPFIIYAGGEHAVLFRNSNRNDAVVLTCLHERARPLMDKASVAVVAEKAPNNKIKRDYIVHIKHMTELPIEIISQQ